MSAVLRGCVLRLDAKRWSRVPFRVHFGSNGTPNVTVNRGALLRPFAFAALFTGGSLAGASLWQYEAMRAKALGYRRDNEYKALQWRRDAHRLWNSLSDEQKVFAPIFALNALAFAAWRLPRLQPFMLKYFCSNPGARALCWPMVLSTFSHYSTLHLLANMFVLYSFSSGVVSAMGKEQFVAVYLAGGVISSFASYLHKVLLAQPGLSLGASGAIMAILGYVCTEYPDTRLSVIFLPMYTFPAETGLKFLLALDVSGIIFGWKFFDHAAHLGGALWGICWSLWGNEHVWQKREKFLMHWHRLRNASSAK